MQKKGNKFNNLTRFYDFKIYQVAYRYSKNHYTGIFVIAPAPSNSSGNRVPVEINFIPN